MAEKPNSIRAWVRENFSSQPVGPIAEYKRLLAVSKAQGNPFDSHSLRNAVRTHWLKLKREPGEHPVAMSLENQQAATKKAERVVRRAGGLSKKEASPGLPTYATSIADAAIELRRRDILGEDVKWEGEGRDPRELSWITGNLSYMLRPHGQTRLYRWIQRWQKNNPGHPGPLLICCHRRFGKGFVSYLLGMEYGVRWPRMRVRIFSPSKEQGVDVSDDVWPDVLNDMPDDIQFDTADGDARIFNPHWKLPSGEPCDPTNDRSLVVMHGTEVKLGRRGRGVGANVIIMDEVQEMENLDKVLGRVIGPQVLKKKHPLVLLLFTPPHKSHPLNEHFIPQAIADGRIFFQPLSTDEDFSEEEIKPLENLVGKRDSLNWRIEMECEWQLRDDSTTLVLPEWSFSIREAQAAGNPNEAIWTSEYPLPKYYYPLVAVDWSYRNFSSALYHYWDWEAKKWVIRREIWTRKGRNTPEMLKLIKDTTETVFPNPPHEVRYHMDLTSDQQAHDVRTLWSFYFSGADKTDRMVSLAAINVMIASKELVVHSSCRALLRQLECGSFKDEKNDKFASDYREDPANLIGDLDALDALRYGWKALRSVKKMDPNPETGQFIGHLWVPDEEDEMGTVVSEEVMG